MFLSRQSLVEAVVNGFSLGEPKGKVTYWVCTLENHANSGEHYHILPCFIYTNIHLKMLCIGFCIQTFF